MLQCAIRPEDARAVPVNGWYAGTDAIQKGELFCTDLDYGTATTADPSRANRIVRPSASGAGYLRTVHGVAAHNYSAKATGQKVECLAPGSVAEIAILAAPTLGDLVTGLAGSGAPGRFVAGKFRGRGSATVLRTIAAIASLTDYNDGCFSSSLDGTAALAISGTTYTLTKTGAFAYVPATANLTGREYVYLVAGATQADGTVTLTPGRYKIIAKTSNDAVILDPAGTAPAASSVDCNFYCVRGNPTVLALLDGPTETSRGNESGLVEWITPYTDASGTTVVDSMIGGFTNIFGGITVGTGDAIHSLADGTYIGQFKAWLLSGALTTSDYMVNATSSNIVGLATSPADTSQAATDLNFQAIASFEFDADGDFVLLEWSGTKWLLRHFVGVTLA